MKYDVAIIGAGIVGCAVARTLARTGTSVVVLEREGPGREASWAAAGMLAPQAEADGPDALLALLLLAGDHYRELVPELEEETALDLGYSRDGMLLVATEEAEEAKLARRYAWQSAAGLPIERLTGDEARRMEPLLAPGVRSALHFTNDRRVDNRTLVRALWFSAAASGARFRVGQGVASVEASRDSVVVVLDDGERISAGKVVIAAGSWSGGITGLPRELPVEPVHGQLLSVLTEPPLLRHAIGSSRGYLVPRADGQVIAGTTAERVGFRRSVTLEGMRKIADTAIEIAPSLAGRPLSGHWSGFRPGTPDGLPILGEDPDFPSIVYATGHFRNGILLGPITGEMIGEVVLGRESRVDLDPFRPTRFATS